MSSRHSELCTLSLILACLFNTDPVTRTGFFRGNRRPLGHPIHDVHRDRGCNFRGGFPNSCSSIRGCTGGIVGTIGTNGLRSTTRFRKRIHFGNGDSLGGVIGRNISCVRLHVLSLSPADSIKVQAKALHFVHLLTNCFVVDPSLGRDRTNHIVTHTSRVGRRITLRSPATPYRCTPATGTLVHRLRLFIGRVRTKPRCRRVLSSLRCQIGRPRAAPDNRLIRGVGGGSLISCTLRRTHGCRSNTVRTLQPFHNFRRGGNGLDTGRLTSSLFNNA